ncbi:MAG TPA: SDR family NAD(P)-dependent oxidoreductase, partial [Solirubrobacterales bacterium]
GAKTKRLTVSHAFHSPLMEPMLEEFSEVAQGLTFNEPQIPIVSNVSGEILSPDRATDPAYWVAQVREPVRFATATESLAELGAAAFVEVGPEPVLVSMAAETLEGKNAALIPTLRSGRAEPETIARAIASAHVSGAKLDWDVFFEGTGAKRVPLPTYPFQRERFWIDPVIGGPDGLGQRSAEHPLIRTTVEIAGEKGDNFLLTGQLSLATHPWLADHAVMGTVLLPGTAFLELALYAAERAGAEQVQELTLQAPLVLPEKGAVQIQASVEVTDEGQWQIAIHSRLEDRGEDVAPEWTRHATGLLNAEQASSPEPLVEWPPKGAEPIDLSSLYEDLSDLDLEYGPAFQGLTAAWRKGEEILAEVSLADAQVEEAERFGIHPALLDSALHAAVLAAIEQDEAVGLPFSWSAVGLTATGPSELRVRLRLEEEAIRLDLADPTGAPVARVGSLYTRPVSAEQLRAGGSRQDPLLGIEWREVELPTFDPSANGTNPTIATIGELQLAGADCYETIAALLEAIESGAPAPQAVLLEVTAKASEQQAEAARTLTQRTLGTVQEWLSQEGLAGSRLALLTTAGVATAEAESPELSSASLWGLLRSAQSEHPGRFALIDSDGSEESIASFGQALAQTEEPQLALREGKALAPRLAASQGEGLLPPPGPWRLDAPKRGTLEALELIPNPAAQEPLTPNEVRVEVKAAGLNFRDVLIALGLYPGQASIGGEAAGVVVEIGEEVSELAPGERVMGMISDSFGPLAKVPRELLVPIPDEWSFAQAAAIPIAFLTASYGLQDLARLKAGERVLVHAGAGGVGMAAIKIAKHTGAEVFATASVEKHEVLRELGLDEDHIASSRDLGFKDSFLATTEGKGVDVVLNALAGEFIDASLELLPDGGRFIEMGKTDVRDPEQVAQEHEGVSYRAFDLFEAGPVRIGEMLGEVVDLLRSGAIDHSPISTFDLRKAPQAFRHLREGKNVGKLVLEVPQGLDPERTVLITGATGGLGALIARHLVTAHGARQLLLISRRGMEAEGAEELQAELTELGAQVRIEACDASEREQLKALIDSIGDEHPLGAVIHAAGVLDDATIESLDAEQLEHVFAPKADAAWHLHELTRSLDLTAFVTFSSAAGTLGGPGQGNYAAANTFLDALSQRRRSEGLPATSIAWGLWAEQGGMGGGLGEADLARMEQGGIGALSAEQGLALFDAALRAERAVAVALRTNSAGLRTLASIGVLPPIMRDLVRAPRRRAAASAAFLEQLASLAGEERQRAVLEMVLSQVAAVLGHSSAEGVDPGKAFQELGFDSLAAVELRNRLATATGMSLQPTLVFDHPTSEAVAVHLLARLAPAGDAVPEMESEEREIREALASIPLSRLRQAGLMDSLMRLVDVDDEVELETADDGADIDEMDIEELLQKSAEGISADGDGEEAS